MCFFLSLELQDIALECTVCKTKGRLAPEGVDAEEQYCPFCFKYLFHRPEPEVETGKNSLRSILRKRKRKTTPDFVHWLFNLSPMIKFSES